MATDPTGDKSSGKEVKPDPFPDIQPSLLNSADIEDYIRARGMVRPYDRKHLKSASYAVSIGSTLIYWDDQKKQREKELAENEEFKLLPNSIVYITTDELFELPPYIAMRFNLHISFVHAGLLLGTGPLVDPGWGGRLLIPLHNLTSNTVRLRRGQELIWVEFTKVSPNALWGPKVGEEVWQRKGKYEPFKENKKYLGPLDYLDKALRACEYKFVRSSIPDAVVDAKNSAESAKNEAQAAKNEAGAAKVEAEKSQRRSTWISLAGTIAVVTLVVVILFGLWQVYSDVRNLVAQTHSDLQSRVTATVTKQEADTVEQNTMIAAKLAELEKYRVQKAQELDDRLSALEREITDLKQQIARGKGK